MITQAVRPRGDPTVTDLVTAPERRSAGLGRARRGVRPAGLVDLPPAPARRADAEDAAQTVWLRLVDQLDRLRDPDALPGWLATTTRRECLRPSTPRARQTPSGWYSPPRTPRPAGRGGRAGTARGRAPRRAARGLHRPAAALPAAACPAHPGPARLLRRDQCSAGHLGRQHRAMRRRCLDGLRRHPAIAALIDTEVGSADPRQAGHDRHVNGNRNLTGWRLHCLEQTAAVALAISGFF